MPIDFDAYSVEDKDTPLNARAPLKEEDKLWRISSLTAYVDDDTRIILLPEPESKRKVKIIDTKYEFSSVNDLIVRKLGIEGELKQSAEVKESKKFEDMT